MIMRKAGLTLVEIMVVISVIALILSFLFPVLFSARERAKTVKCQSNIRQIGITFDLYHENNDCLPYAYVLSDAFPESVNKANDATVDWPGARWYYYLGLMPERYAPYKSILHCPSKSLNEPKFKYNIQWGNYGVNWSVCKSPRSSLPLGYQEFEGRPTNRSSLQKPGETLLLADSGYAWIAWFHTLPKKHLSVITTQYITMNQNYLPGASVNFDPQEEEEENPLSPAQKEDAIQGRHPGKTVNGLFTDGHVENKKANDLMVQPLDHGQFRKLTPLWRP
jgi:prepilin-type processing-associated H-X9-DG protein/prepilin-type N-terminal cleavage/methylation domain-containing protein